MEIWYSDLLPKGDSLRTPGRLQEVDGGPFAFDLLFCVEICGKGEPVYTAKLHLFYRCNMRYLGREAFSRASGTIYLGLIHGPLLSQRDACYLHETVQILNLAKAPVPVASRLADQ